MSKIGHRRATKVPDKKPGYYFGVRIVEPAVPPKGATEQDIRRVVREVMQKSSAS